MPRGFRRFVLWVIFTRSAVAIVISDADVYAGDNGMLQQCAAF